MSTELAVVRMSPRGKLYAQHIENSCIRFDIQEAIHKAHFLATLAHESMGFTVVQENLNYSAKGLLATFGKYFTAETATVYARQPQRIANIVYANRMGNRGEHSGDGWAFRGRGLIQLTGRHNYRDFSIDYFGDDRLVRAPDRLAEPDLAAMCAGWFWKKNNINRLVDEDDLYDLFANNDDIRQVTRRVNGGYNGLKDRERWLKLAKEALWVSR